jgi:hypothetical protein
VRKSLMGAIAVTAALGLTTAAVAQTGEVSLNVKVGPPKAGTKQKPKNSRLTFAQAVNLPTATVEQIRLRWPATLKLSGKGFPRCDFDELVATGVSACPRGSAAGPQGRATAAVGPTRAPLNFRVNAFVEDANTLLFYLDQTGGGVQTALRGEIRGRQLTITIPLELRQPGGLDATLTGLNYQFRGRAGRNYIFASTGCKARRHTLAGTLIFSARIDGAPVPAPVTTTTSVPCRP